MGLFSDSDSSPVSSQFDSNRNETNPFGFWTHVVVVLLLLLCFVYFCLFLVAFTANYAFHIHSYLYSYSYSSLYTQMSTWSAHLAIWPVAKLFTSFIYCAYIQWVCVSASVFTCLQILIRFTDLVAFKCACSFAIQLINLNVLIHCLTQASVFIAFTLQLLHIWYVIYYIVFKVIFIYSIWCIQSQGIKLVTHLVLTLHSLRKL